jgi:hypothetical protein
MTQLSCGMSWTKNCDNGVCQGLSIVLYLCFTEGLPNERIGLLSPLDAWRGFAMWLGADG